MSNYPDEKLVICTTGSQGEPMSALVRMAANDYKRVKLKRGDTVIISATPIPGNERSIGRTINNLFKLGVNVIYGQQRLAHVSGHGRQEELLLMLNLTQPKYFLPVHGEYRMLVQHARLARADRDRIRPTSSSPRTATRWRSPDSGARFGGRISGAPVYVDGLGVGDVGNVVLRDRRHLSGDGMIIVTVTVDSEDGKVLAGPDIISRGFTYGGDGDGLVGRGAPRGDRHHGERCAQEPDRVVGDPRTRPQGSVEIHLRPDQTAADDRPRGHGSLIARGPGVGRA